MNSNSGSSNSGATANGTIPSSGQSAMTNGVVNAQPSTPNSNSTPGSQCAHGTSMTEDHKLALKQWHYCIQLAKYMFEEGLLDRQELLQWILDLLDKMRSQPADDGILKLLLPLALQYLEEFVQSELLARRLAFMCCKKIAHMCNNVDLTCSPQSPSGATMAAAVGGAGVTVKSEMNGCKNELQSPPQTAAPVVNQLNAVFNDYLNCPHHRDVLYGLSTIIQVYSMST